MLPARDEALWADAESDLRRLETLVRDRLLAEAGTGWSEVSRDYADDLTYLSIALDRGEIGAILRMEFGVRVDADWHATGMLVARWDGRRVPEGISALEIVAIDGEPVEVPRFVDALEPYLELPLVLADEAEDR
ncbi:hypothetical protein NY96_19565 [Xanthomonas citri pv. fuscans]|uniref:hypothetical protein n=1 Tax=Xanthomonas TaxID=338 RepID=UPI00037D2F2D|nr:MULTISPECIES: hypothetical protein [Xanthomonas]KGT53987.1 hypothetical protein NY96_19565 [Xanthomonas citri pv. fuscans]